MGAVRAKFKCHSIKLCEGCKVVELGAVSDPANTSWSKWTPSGQLTMSITNPEAADAFEVGKTYFLDFSEAPAKEADEAK